MKKKGLLLYGKKDYEKNKAFADWIKKEAKKNKLEITLIFRDDLPDRTLDISRYSFVINRSRDYNLSLLFELNDLRVFNNSKICLLGNNKLSAYSYAKTQGVEFADVLVNPFKSNQVLSKPICGHGGEGIETFEQAYNIDKGYFYQQYLNEIQGDIRFYILKNQIHSAVIRFHESALCSNYSLGGKFQLYPYNRKEEDFVLRFIRPLDIDYAGVDFFLGKQGNLIFNEIEDAVGSRMLSELSINDTVDRFLYNIAKELYDSI